MAADTIALVMAGGRSSRMRESAGPVHKALLPIDGVSLLDRNIGMLVRQGFRNIAVAVSAREADLLRAVRALADQYAQGLTADIQILQESEPLGTIGAAGLIQSACLDVLVINVDNLTSLDLTDLVCWHRSHRAAMTIATHLHDFHIPFGEIVLTGDRVGEYREKPVKSIRISSGTYVLSSGACAAIPACKPVNVPDLFAQLTATGAAISAFTHDAPWIDINTASDIARAEGLLRQNADAFRFDRAHSVAH